MPAKVASLGETMQQEAQRKKRAGPTVPVRATAKGYYGYPIADVQSPGDVFPMRVADLVVFDPEKNEVHKKKKDYLGRPLRLITHGKATYVLPTWCEDAKGASSLKGEDEDEDGEYAANARLGDEVL